MVRTQVGTTQSIRKQLIQRFLGLFYTFVLPNVWRIVSEFQIYFLLLLVVSRTKFVFIQEEPSILNLKSLEVKRKTWIDFQTTWKCRIVTPHNICILCQAPTHNFSLLHSCKTRRSQPFLSILINFVRLNILILRFPVCGINKILIVLLEMW